MIHPTRRAALALGVAAPLAAGVAIAAPGLWLFAAAWLGAVLAAFSVDVVALLNRRALIVELRAPAALHVGESEVATLVLRGRRPADVEALVDVAGPARPLTPTLVVADGAPVAEAPFVIRTTRRGMVRLERVWLRADGPLRMAARNESRKLGIAVAVAPNIAAVKREALAFAAADAPLGAKPQIEKGSGTEFEALRDYASGLDRRAIDWKHSARHGKLVCKEFQTERNHQVVLALDTGHLMGQPVDGVPKLDRACTALLLLGYASLKSGDRVGFCAFDARMRAFLAPHGNLKMLARLQRAAAAVDYSLQETNFTLALTELGGRLTRRSLIVVATDFVDTVTAALMVENIGQLAKKHLVVFLTFANTALHRHFLATVESVRDVSRAVVAHDLLRERQAVLSRLSRLGVLCVEAPTERLGSELVNRYLAIKARDLI